VIRAITQAARDSLAYLPPLACALQVRDR